MIAPYDATLNAMRVLERRDWAEKVLEKLLPAVRGYRRIVFFAGQRYREFLIPSLRTAGHEIVVPLDRLRLGEQLRWFSRRG